MADNLGEHFKAFELLDDDEPMRGFKRVVRGRLRDWETILKHPAFEFEKPFDVRFTKSMVKTLSYLVGADPDLVFAFSEHGEFSILMGGPEPDNGDAGRSLLCRIASNAAAQMSLLLGDLAIFDAHLYQFPSPELAKAYFQWRQRENQRVALDRYVLHLANPDGDEEKAGTILEFGEEEKLAILTEHEVEIETLPPWLFAGAGIFWKSADEGPEPTLQVDAALPTGTDYQQFLESFL